MTMADISNGPAWIGYAGAVLFFILSAILLSGHGSWLIAGYNTASKKEKEKYNERKLCRVMGGCLGIIAVLILVTCIFEHQLPAGFVYIMIAIIILDVIITMILSNTICKK